MAKHLTPDERAAIVARYVETANALRVAEEFGVSESNVRRILSQARAAKKNDLHAQACARGVREGRRALAKTAKRLQRWMDDHGDPSAPSMEPGDVAKMASALRGVIAGVVEIDEHRNKSALSRLTRELRRAEIELARLKIAAGGVEKHEHVVTATGARSALAAAIAGSAGADVSDAEDGGAREPE